MLFTFTDGVGNTHRLPAANNHEPFDFSRLNSRTNLTTPNRTLTLSLDNIEDTSPNEFASARIPLLRRSPPMSHQSLQLHHRHRSRRFPDERCRQWRQRPATLNGTRIFLNDTPAFLSFPSPGQGKAIVERNGVRSRPVTAPARTLNPAFFAYDERNRPFIAPANRFGGSTLNGLAVRPARPRDFFVAPGTIPALYTGLSSFAGAYIVGFQIPADFANGHRKLRIAVHGIASPTGVVIPIIRADTRFRPVSA